MTAHRWAILIAGMLGLCAILLAFAMPRATAAERTLSGEYEISFFRRGIDYTPSIPTHETIAGPIGSPAWSVRRSLKAVGADPAPTVR